MKGTVDGFDVEILLKGGCYFIRKEHDRPLSEIVKETVVSRQQIVTRLLIKPSIIGKPSQFCLQNALRVE